MEAPGHARRACAAQTKGLSDGVATTASLLVSELVTNTVRHGDCKPDDVLEVHFDREPGRLRVAVCQRTALGDLHVVTNRERREGGWGLMLVDKLAQEWGVGSDPNCVWFRLAA